MFLHLPPCLIYRMSYQIQLVSVKLQRTPRNVCVEMFEVLLPLIVYYQFYLRNLRFFSLKNICILHNISLFSDFTVISFTFTLNLERFKVLFVNCVQILTRLLVCNFIFTGFPSKFCILWEMIARARSMIVLQID